MPVDVYPGGSATFREDGYGYEWMDAASQFNDLLREFIPTIEELGDLFGFLPREEPEPKAIEVQPAPARPWYEGLPPWVWGLITALGAVLAYKLLEEE